MITTLSFTIHGTKRAVNRRSNEFFTEMHKIMNKPIDGIRLVGLHRKSSDESLAHFKKRMVASLFDTESNV